MYRDLTDDGPSGAPALGCEDGQTVFYAKVLADLQNTLMWYRFSAARDWVLSPRQWWATYRGKKGVFAEFSYDDPLVMLFAIFDAIKQFAIRGLSVARGRRFR